MYILQIEKLYKKYNDFQAIKGIDLNIEKGELYGLLGPNGAGKSTLIKIISGIENITGGRVIFEEKETNISKYKKNIGLLPQDIAIYNDLTARENVSFFCSLYGYRGKELKERVNKALEFVGLLDVKGKQARQFSGGMKRRLNMACAIAHSPKLIIMDEPTVGIDPQSRNHILQSVKRLNEEGATIIYTSHYMEEIEELCSNISIIDNGKVIAKGTKEYLKESIVTENICTIKLKREIYNLESHLNNLKDVNKVNVNKTEVKCYYSKEKNVLPYIINIITNNSGIIVDIRNEVPTLENVFLKLTGKQLRD